MFKIGEFSKLSQVTVKTLRYYDKLGLLKPAEVDRFTSYRYYSASQLPRLNRILALKDLGLSLDQIGQLLEDDLSPEQIRGMLRLKQAEIRQQVQEEQARLARVEQRLRYIEQEDKMPTYDVVVKKVASQRVAAVRGVIPSYGEQGQLWDELCAYLAQHKLESAGPCFTLYYDEGYKERDVDAEVCEPVSADAPLTSRERVKVYELPTVETMACVVHRGRYDDLGQAYMDLLAWIEANGYQIAGPNRDVYLSGPESGGDPTTYVTEVQVPVEKM